MLLEDHINEVERLVELARHHDSYGAHEDALAPMILAREQLDRAILDLAKGTIRETIRETSWGG